MTEDETPRERALSAELGAAFRNRADLYRLFYDELRREVGPERAEGLMTRIVERRGREVSEAAFGSYGPNDAVRLGEAFLAVSPDGGRMYPVEVERGPHSIRFEVKRCPLKDAWVAAGLSGVDIGTLCRIAGAFDKGLFETCGVRFENVTWHEGHGSDCCHITLSDRDPP